MAASENSVSMIVTSSRICFPHVFGMARLILKSAAGQCWRRKNPGALCSDLRRTAATRMAELGTLPHVVEAVLNHVSGEVSGVGALYNRYSYYAEKKRALAGWVKLLDRIASVESGSAVVVPIGRTSRMRS